jgi:sugar phosphate isomerase/epimerase
MPKTLKNLAVQSWCFRSFKDNQKVASLLKELGLSSIELCAVHCDFKNPSAWAPALKTYKDAKVRIVSIGVEGFGPDEADARTRFEFAKQAGCKVISATFNPATFAQTVPVVTKLADEYNINLAIHNHGGYNWLGNSEILDHVFHTTSPRIGLCLDTAWALDASQDPVKMAEKFASRLYSVHIKDFVFDKAGHPEDVVVGTGNLKLADLMKTLKAGGFKGEMILEYEGDVENPLPALAKCVAAVHAAA